MSYKTTLKKFIHSIFTQKIQSKIENMSYTSGNTRYRRVEEQLGSKTNPHFSMGNRYPKFFLFPMESGLKNNFVIISSHKFGDTHTIIMMKHENKVEMHGTWAFLCKGSALGNERFVFRNEGFVPKYQSFVFRNEGFVPKTQSSVFQNESSVPENESPVFKNEGFVPKNESLFFRNAGVVFQYKNSVSECKDIAMREENADLEKFNRCFMPHVFKKSRDKIAWQRVKQRDKITQERMIKSRDKIARQRWLNLHQLL
jgi:hypothetical protein